MRRTGTVPLGLLSLFSVGCERELSIGRLWLDASSQLTEGGTPTPVQAAFSCDQRGPLFALSDGADTACASGASGFHHALCSCSELVLGQVIQTDGFDSRQGPYRAGQPGGSLAAVGGLFPQGMRVGGSLIVAGAEGIPLSSDIEVGGSLFDQGQLQGQYAVRVAGSARIGGDVRLASLSVAGTCTLAPASALEVTNDAPQVTREAVTIAPPCRCDGALDMAAVLAAASRSNDDARLGLDPDNTFEVFDSALELSLPCGRYYVSDINSARALTLHVQGRVALHVQHGIVVENSGSLTIDLADGAELDLFVGDNIAAAGPVRIGSIDTPTRTRLHFGGDALFLASPTTLAATLYAPNAELVNEAPLELYGTALLRRVAATQTLTLHQDQALCP